MKQREEGQEGEEPGESIDFFKYISYFMLAVNVMSLIESYPWCSRVEDRKRQQVLTTVAQHISHCGHMTC